MNSEYQTHLYAKAEVHWQRLLKIFLPYMGAVAILVMSTSSLTPN